MSGDHVVLIFSNYIMVLLLSDLKSQLAAFHM